MKSWLLLGGLIVLSVLPCTAQQIIYSSLKEFVSERGDTVSILKVEKRTKSQILLMGGADYRIEAEGNSGLSRYLRSRCYAVRIDTALYVNCRKMRYKSFRFGQWYAPAMQLRDKVYYCAQPVGQVATSTASMPDAARLGGEVGDAIAASGLVNERVYYELDLETGKSVFVGKEKMLQLLQSEPAWHDRLLQETSESADVIRKYLLLLRP